MDVYDEITKNYPRLFSQCKCIECGPGWARLIDDLSKKLEELIEQGGWEENYHPAASQVKEKYGTLRFYMSTSTEEMGALIDEAEEGSSQICEICGMPGKLRNRQGWYYTACDAHVKN